MTQQQPQPIRRDYRLRLDLLSATAGKQDASSRLNAILSGRRNDQSQALDDLLSELGNAYVESGRVGWEPPSDLDPTLASYLAQSIEALNKRMDAGDLSIEDGNIVPSESAQGEQPTRAPRLRRPWRP